METLKKNNNRYYRKDFQASKIGIDIFKDSPTILTP